ncbi:hypothetical protein [Mycolicibacterium houstonense]|uniref:hypothetical protein n=1 Tax=Mycolicibacterium houstonense TaxID=146021 RepID=UPI00082EF999|nr:hypothetical protein [Mycolicibacterium houstonense]
MAKAGSLHVDITAKVTKVVAHVDLYTGGKKVGTTEVDVTPQPEPGSLEGDINAAKRADLNRQMNIYTSGRFGA